MSHAAPPPSRSGGTGSLRLRHNRWRSLTVALAGGALLLVVADLRVPITMVSVAVALALTGWTSARLGYGPPGRAVLRNVGGGVFAMVVTFLVGSALGTTIG